MQRIGERERAYVQQVLDSQFRTSAGSLMTKPLEQLFAETFDSRFAIAFINGTATMHAALAAAGVGPGDEVIVPPLTMASTAFAVLHANAIPVFADIDPKTWTIDPQAIAACITPRTKAIIPVSIYGLAPAMDGIMELAARHNLFVLEDDAECFLGYYKGRIVGSIGHASSFSFQSTKHMTSGEGGMITTNDEGLAEGIRRFNSLGYAAVGAAAGKGKITRATIQDPLYERHVSIGFNYRMPELCAAVALAQLERLRELVDLRIQAARLYEQALAGCPWLTPQATPDGYIHSYWTYVACLAPEVDFSWYDFRNKYKEMGGDGIYAAWQLNYLEPAFRQTSFHPEQTQVFARGLCPVAEAVQPRLLQFKTNYFDLAVAAQKAEALARTIAYFG
ncbi:MAG: DegT/DnrJ/EryC1/StrS family aminotransferase [Chloroflexi bacterium]|nr:DegT/DnrJ/EryC1/StrS family aminotransferase [Chloroflexota bacterium]